MKKFFVPALLACGVMGVLHSQKHLLVGNVAAAANVSTAHANTKTVDDCLNCTAVNKKCINGVCEWGQIHYTSSQTIPGTPIRFRCFYHYEWSDGSISPTYYVIQGFACLQD
ncbi:hypothetical protein [Chitinophaga sp. RAB17]|uniref:hypothetical protein n=1 Tax=Chitinophaga sp. RAB17 TaxID=3233049 RepID=UPI003F91EE92